VKRLLADVAREFGGLDVLVNHVGVYSFGPLESVTKTECQRQYATNVLGTLLGDPGSGEVARREGRKHH
jgi:3-oxoacyl-[acyl-carrier protein] reductase